SISKGVYGKVQEFHQLIESFITDVRQTRDGLYKHLR
ncbi:hypothetical protein EZS27_038121, partial [termite gut metagenome]